MTRLNVHSQNLRGSLLNYPGDILKTLEDKDCECTAIFLQDLGVTGPDGPSSLRGSLGEHHVYANSKLNNKSRTVAIIVHSSWSINHIYRDPTGSLIGVVITRGGIEILLVSAYLPASLDTCGYPELRNEEKSLRNGVGNERHGIFNATQEEAHAIYQSLSEWINRHPLWLVGGDLNETRAPIDRSQSNKQGNSRRKFVDVFLEDSNGVDVWRRIYPKKPGLTYQHTNGSKSRLDYFLGSSSLLELLTNVEMRLGQYTTKTDQDRKKVSKLDHRKISFFSSLPVCGYSSKGRPWSIPQPRLANITPSQILACKTAVNEALSPILERIRGSPPMTLDEADRLSKITARILVDSTGAIVGSKLPTHEKRKYQPLDVIKAKAEITTIYKARDLIHTLHEGEFNSTEERRRIEDHLSILLDRLVRMGLNSIPRSLDIKSLNEWSQLTAQFEILNLEEYMKKRKCDMFSVEMERQRKLFLDPRKRGKWFELLFGAPMVTCPNFIVDAKTGKRSYDEKEVKRIYVEEGASLLRNRIDLPPPFDESQEQLYQKPPNPQFRETKKPPLKPHQRPRWWDKMYNRQAKNISSQIWSGLMTLSDWKEVQSVIISNGSQKSAGLDGVTCDLVRMHSDDSINKPSPFLEILTTLINIALQQGKTLKSWRKAIISMIPKRKDDGSLTNKIGEMRPISVLQEFGKIAAKILSNRLGNILLRHPHLLNSAQRAFLKDGNTSQCITTLLNILDDFKSKQKKDPTASLFILAYDQVKAYDSVQAYTIKASLERFNLPNEFISYVLSNLEDATSCFKTFYGPTDEFKIENSVRQGDPLSPLIYILVTDALHEGIKRNPIFNCRTGYSFSKTPALKVASLGYADDTLTCNESWADQWMSHEWIRDFCHAHNFKLNASKCRYIISNHMGPNDGRWLWSVDGSEMIRPLPSAETFRYLGLWLSMDLDWSKQIHVMNKCIADWRWKALTNKVDSAQLRASYVEFLLPRLEIGLLHAHITEQICNAWTSSIIFTLCKRGGLPSGQSLNRMAFCLLADIPDLWLHLNTIRATEFLCHINSRNSDAGLSTVARFCAIMGCPDLPSAAKKLEWRKKFPLKINYRICSPLRYFRLLGIKLISPPSQTELNTSRIIQEISLALSESKCNAIVYTDGSTSPQGKSPNSGSGIYITDEQHTPLWSGGFTVRTDGNNFIAELAAAAVVIKACPKNVSVRMKIDSMATIGALSKGPLSERRRIRAPGRAWLNFCRAEIEEKEISMDHVPSHTGTMTPEQRGNDVADAMANKYRLEGESMGPVPYLVSTEEPLILEFKGSNIQGDPRSFLKKMAKEKMAEIWRTKSKQGEWFNKHPTQILKQAKLVWKWSTESGYGGAWLYYILGICQWLPTNYRINYNDCDEKKRCSLCLSGSQETLEHVLRCPALVEDIIHVRQLVKSRFDFWKIPYNNLLFISRENGLRLKWKNAAREKFSSDTLSCANIDKLTAGFWKTNQNKQFISTRDFMEKLSTMMENRDQSPFYENLPGHDLLNILIKDLSLQTHGLTDSLHFSPLFEDWTSVNPLDLPFGAKLWADTSLHVHQGTNTFMFHGSRDQVNTQGLFEVLAESLCTNLPTRFVCIVPCQEKLPPHFLEIAVIHPNAPLFGFHSDRLSSCSMSIILAANKESLQTDPINWDKLAGGLSEWSDHIQISQSTDNLFRERITLHHAPRALSKHPHHVVSNGISLINFYDAFAPMERSQNVGSIPPRAADLITKMNRHPRFLSLLGILPNQLRTLLKELGFEKREEAISDLARTLFFAGFSIWSKRQKMASRFWKDITAKKRKKKKRKRHEIEDDIVSSKCKNPFHFLKRHRNLSKQRHTRCPCSKDPPIRKEISSPMTSFIPEVPIEPPFSDILLFISRTDHIRAQHDRGKRRKPPMTEKSKQRKKKKKT